MILTFCQMHMAAEGRGTTTVGFLTGNSSFVDTTCISLLFVFTILMVINAHNLRYHNFNYNFKTLTKYLLVTTPHR